MISPTLKHSLAALILLSGFIACTPAATLTGKVVGVSDGDTITVLDAQNVQHKIRLAGIDAPEKSQAFGDRSKQYLSDQVFGKTVNIEWEKFDKYGRTIGKVMVGGQDANLNQVRAGLAWHYKKYEKEQASADRFVYAQAEVDARVNRMGLWHDNIQIAPWDFRHGGNNEAASDVVRVKESGGSCPCGEKATCTGPKGGTYCLTFKGKKKYF